MPATLRLTGPAGLRERNKSDKLRRIKDAARELFVSNGFDETTTREIAIRAGVGIGTVFTYADNKRDLLFLVANDELAEVTATAEASLRKDASCLQNLSGFFRHHYKFFARQPELSRLLLREMTFYDSGQQASRFQQTREKNIKIVGDLMQMAADRKAIRIAEDPQFVGWVAFCIFQVELRRWLMSKSPVLSSGVKSLERALRLLMTGLDATPGALNLNRS
ncbi:MAG: TetR/AcrR family transcriptional regulator [Xanthobacteraceae bacterium]|nr:TetR/AcrR family transcriptional regulator [Xanthobacteraceae bacterium]